MKFIPVKINEGGYVTMKDEERKKLHGEEAKLGNEMCDIINDDPKLKRYFAEFTKDLLLEFAQDIIKAYMKKDEQLRDETVQKAFDLIKALTMQMYVKVSMKKKEVKP